MIPLDCDDVVGAPVRVALTVTHGTNTATATATVTVEAGGIVAPIEMGWCPWAPMYV